MDLSTKKILLDTAAIFAMPTGVDVQTVDLATITANAIGTTSGGVEVSAKPIIREVEFDGKLERKIAGMERVMGWEVSATAEGLELLENNLTLSLFTKTTPGGAGAKYTEYKPKSGILANGDYKDLLIVGTQADGKKAIALIRNTFNEDGLNIKTEDNNEGKMKMTFNGRYKLGDTPVDPFAFYVGI